MLSHLKTSILIILCTLIISCQKEEEFQNFQVNHSNTNVSNKHLQMLEKAGIKTAHFHIKYKKPLKRQGNKNRQKIIAGDIIFDVEALERGLYDMKANKAKHYITNFGILNYKRTITVAAYTGSGVEKLTKEMVKGLEKAVKQYNSLNIKKLKFKISYVSHFNRLWNYDLQVYRTTDISKESNIQGWAFFPWKGDIGGPIELSTHFHSNKISAWQSLITHELGHSIGLAHQDWESLYSCGVPEESNDIDAYHIPGTARSSRAPSIMTACSDFEYPRYNKLTGPDKRAIKKLYKQG